MTEKQVKENIEDLSNFLLDDSKDFDYDKWCSITRHFQTLELKLESKQKKITKRLEFADLLNSDIFEVISGKSGKLYGIQCAECHVGTHMPHKDNCSIGNTMEKVLRVVEEVPMIDDWIGVHESLPEFDKESFGRNVDVIVTDSINFVGQMSYQIDIVRGKEVHRFKWNDRIAPWKVTHWMYLPEIPRRVDA